jgi:hypothetical protein
MMASQEFTQKLYEQAAQEESSAAGATTPPPDDDEVVDAEIVEDADDESESA